MGKLYKKGGEINPDNKGIKNYFAHGSGKAGGVLVGKRHSEGGIKALNKSTGQPLEMEGGEVVITRNAVSDNTKREFNGQMLTNREILSKINESGGGVSFAKGGDVPKTIYTSGKEYKYGGKTMKDHDIVSSCGCKHEMKKGGSLSKTKAPLKDRVFGSSKNKPGSAASKESAKKITLSDEIVEALQKKVDEYKKQHPSSKLSVTTLKAVMRRGMGAYSTSHRPTITGGAPNSRQAWGYARVNKFLKKKAGQQVKAAYIQDDDLLKSGGRIEWHDSDAPDANGKFKSLNAKELAAWLIKTRGKDVQKISASITQQIVFNRKKDPEYASKMERVRKEVYKQLGRKDLMADGGTIDSFKKVKETHIGTNQSFEGVEYKYKEATIYYNNVDKVWVLTMQKNGKPQKTIGGYKTLKSAQEVGLYYLNNPNLYADGGQMDQDITCVNCGWHWNTKDSDPSDKYVCHKCGFDNRTYYDSDPISKMEKQIALPDTYATYDNLKPILERQGYQINKIMASGGNIHGGKILFTINDDKIDDLLYRSNFDSYVFLDDDGYLLSEKDFERFKVIVSDKGYDENKINVQDWNYTDYKVGGKLINSPDFLKGKKEELEEHRDVFEKLRKKKLTADQAAELVVLEHLKKKPDYYKSYSSGGKIKLQDKNLISYKEFLDLDKRVKSPYADENDYYYPLYCSKEKKIMFFKEGNRRNNSITPQLAYKSFLFHKYKVDFKDLSAKEKNALMLGKQSILENQ